MAKTITVQSIIRKLYVEANGQLVEVKQIDNVDDYPKTVTVYTKELVKGAKAGQSIYCVAVADFIPKKRVSTKESVANMLASGMTAEQIVAKLAGTL